MGTCPIYLCSVCADSMIAFIFFYLCLRLLSPPCVSLSLSLCPSVSLSLARTTGPVSFSVSLTITYQLSTGMDAPRPPFSLSSCVPVALADSLQSVPTGSRGNFTATHKQQAANPPHQPPLVPAETNAQANKCMCVCACVCIKAFSTANLCLGGVINT